MPARSPGRDGRGGGPPGEERSTGEPGRGLLETAGGTIGGWAGAAGDYARRVWDNSGEDNIFFLASGIAFNILLAGVPFFLLLISGLGYVLNISLVASLAKVSVLIDRLLPPGSAAARGVLYGLLTDVIRARGTVGLYSAIGFVWFSTRLFGSLRSVLASVFDIDRDRGIVEGKWFDVRVTVMSTLLVVSYAAISAYLAIATTRGAEVLTAVGVQPHTMGTLTYLAGRLLAFAVIGLMFFAFYKYLPNRHIRAQTASVSALVAAALFEIAKVAFRAYIRHFNPGSFYTGTLAAIAIVIVWVYYAALVFVLGGEVGQVYELRRVRRLQQLHEL